MTALLAGPALAAEPAVRPVVEVVEHPAPLVEAARARDHATIEALLQGKDRGLVNQRSADGTTAAPGRLQRRCPAGDRLLAVGADVNARNDYGSTPLSDAVVPVTWKWCASCWQAGADVESATTTT